MSRHLYAVPDVPADTRFPHVPVEVVRDAYSRYERAAELLDKIVELQQPRVKEFGPDDALSVAMLGSAFDDISEYQVADMLALAIRRLAAK
jgi:hypothetical protein